jgi:hypothetical protein
MSTPAPNLSLTVTLDKDVYEPGDVVNATMTVTQLDSLVVTGSATVDGVTVNNTANASVQSAPTDPVTFGISDNLNGSWSQVSVEANVGTFTETLPA